MVWFIFSSHIIFVGNKLTLSFILFWSVCHRLLSPSSAFNYRYLQKADISFCGIWVPEKDVDGSAASNVELKALFLNYVPENWYRAKEIFASFTHS